MLPAVAVLIFVACDSSAVVSPEEPERVASPTQAEQPPQTEVPEPSRTFPVILAIGEFELPAAQSFGEPGFHEVLTVTQSVPQDIGSTKGLRLVLALHDAGRPTQTCSREHPLSGCATVDWSDAEGRPKVPPGGVFDNQLTATLSSGKRSFFLSDSGDLNDGPDPFKPG